MPIAAPKSRLGRGMSPDLHTPITYICFIYNCPRSQLQCNLPRISSAAAFSQIPPAFPLNITELRSVTYAYGQMQARCTVVRSSIVCSSVRFAWPGRNRTFFAGSGPRRPRARPRRPDRISATLNNGRKRCSIKFIPAGRLRIRGVLACVRAYKCLLIVLLSCLVPRVKV